MIRAACIALLVLLPSTAAAQAWTREAGEVYIQTQGRLLLADGYYAPDGVRRPLPTQFRQVALSAYGEVGVVSRWLTLSADGELVRMSELEQQGRTVALGDTRVSAFTGLLVDPFHLAFGVTLGIPTGDPQPNAAPGADSDAQLVARSLPSGDGEWDVSLRLVAGHSLQPTRDYPLSHYFLGEFSYQIRTNEFVDDVVYRAEAGTRYPQGEWRRFLLILRLAGQQALERVAAGGAAVVGLGNGVSFATLGVDLGVELGEGFSVFLGYDGPVYGENIAAGGAFKLGLAYHRSPN